MQQKQEKRKNQIFRNKAKRKKKNLKPKDAANQNQQEEPKSTLHLIDEMQTFYIKNWETQEHLDNQKTNPQVSAQIHNKKAIEDCTQSLNKQPAYSSSLPRLKPLFFSHSKLKLIWRQKEPGSQRALPKLQQQLLSHSIKNKHKQKKTLYSSRINFDSISPFLQKVKTQQQPTTKQQFEKKTQKQLLYPKKKTQIEPKIETNFKEFKIEPKQNEIAYIVQKHKSNYKSQIIHHINKDELKLNLSNKIFPINMQKINENHFASQPLKHYLSIRRNEKYIN